MKCFTAGDGDKSEVAGVSLVSGSEWPHSSHKELKPHITQGTAVVCYGFIDAFASINKEVIERHAIR